MNAPLILAIIAGIFATLSLLGIFMSFPAVTVAVILLSIAVGIDNRK